jgi:hypothetical protein
MWNDGKALHLTTCSIAGEMARKIGKASLDKTGYAAGWDRDEGYDSRLDKGLY